MIVEFFSRGKGAGSGPVDYLLGKDRERERASVLRGNPDETAAIIDGSAYAKKYTSGCLSFEEHNISEDKKRELMTDFEECLFPNMDKSQYNVLWVEHRDKGRLELNFVIPNIELETGKRLQPYYHNADLKRVDAWRTIKNIENGFSDPEDPAKRQGVLTAKDLPKTQKEAVAAINDAMLAWVGAGAVEDRQGVVKALESAGFELARQTKTSISIKDPDGGRNIRLKGAIYEQDFRFGQGVQSDIEQRSREHKQRAAERLGEAKERYSFGIERRAAELAKRYPRPQPSFDRSPGEQRPGLEKNGLQKPSKNELEPIRDLGLGGVCSTDSLFRAARLERLSRQDDSHDSPTDRRSQADFGDLGGQDVGRGTQEMHTGRGQTRLEAVRPAGQEIHQFIVGRQENADGGLGDEINDGSREIIARFIKENEQRSRERRERNGQRLGAVGTGATEQRAKNAGSLEALRRTAETDRSQNAGSLTGLCSAPRSAGSIDRAASSLGAAKHAADAAKQAVERAFKSVEQSVKHLVAAAKVKVKSWGSSNEQSRGNSRERDNGFSR